jgi:transposase
MTEITIGVDVSKDTLDVHLHPDGTHRQFLNDATGFHLILDWIGSQPVARLVFEASGAYHRAFERAMGEAGIALCKVNPARARRFAEATGQSAKTDRIDAAMLARMGAVLEPDTRAAPSKTACDLKELHMMRTALVKDRTAAKNRAATLTLPLLKRQLRQRLAAIDRQIRQIEQAMHARIEADPELARKRDILISIPGIAERSAFALLTGMPELGDLNSQAAGALSGTAPRTRQSGKWTGRAVVQGGRAHVRRALYMPALAAARFNPELNQTYKSLTARGKPPKLALTAVMRKLIVLANALIRDNRKWTPKPN